jgi:galactose oxidase-like protein
MRATGDGPKYGGLPAKRGWIQAAYDLVSSKVTLFGGDNDTYLSDLWQYDFPSNRWHLVRPHPDLAGPVELSFRRLLPSRSRVAQARWRRPNPDSPEMELSHRAAVANAAIHRDGTRPAPRRPRPEQDNLSRV